jgi:uncharacterized protein
MGAKAMSEGVMTITTEADDNSRSATDAYPASSAWSRFAIDRDYLQAFCERNHIRKLSLFGSVLTERFRPESDVDMLVEFNPGYTPGYFGLVGMEMELSEKVGRKVDLRTPRELSKHFRDEVLAGAAIQYERP